MAVPLSELDLVRRPSTAPRLMEAGVDTDRLTIAADLPTTLQTIIFDTQEMWRPGSTGSYSTDPVAALALVTTLPSHAPELRNGLHTLHAHLENLAAPTYNVTPRLRAILAADILLYQTALTETDKYITRLHAERGDIPKTAATLQRINRRYLSITADTAQPALALQALAGRLQNEYFTAPENVSSGEERAYQLLAIDALYEIQQSALYDLWSVTGSDETAEWYRDALSRNSEAFEDTEIQQLLRDGELDSLSVAVRYRIWLHTWEQLTPDADELDEISNRQESTDIPKQVDEAARQRIQSHVAYFFDHPDIQEELWKGIEREEETAVAGKGIRWFLSNGNEMMHRFLDSIPSNRESRLLLYRRILEEAKVIIGEKPIYNSSNGTALVGQLTDKIKKLGLQPELGDTVKDVEHLIEFKPLHTISSSWGELQTPRAEDVRPILDTLASNVKITSDPLDAFRRHVYPSAIPRPYALIVPSLLPPTHFLKPLDKIGVLAIEQKQVNAAVTDDKVIIFDSRRKKHTATEPIQQSVTIILEGKKAGVKGAGRIALTGEMHPTLGFVIDYGPNSAFTHSRLHTLLSAALKFGQVPPTVRRLTTTDLGDIRDMEHAWNDKADKEHYPKVKFIADVTKRKADDTIIPIVIGEKTELLTVRRNQEETV